MRPKPSILDPSFRYEPSFATSVASTWRRAGWQPTTNEQRKARQKSGSSNSTRAALYVLDATRGAVFLASPDDSAEAVRSTHYRG